MNVAWEMLRFTDRCVIECPAHVRLNFSHRSSSPNVSDIEVMFKYGLGKSGEILRRDPWILPDYQTF